MAPAPESREDDARLIGARAEFVGSLPRRLEALRGALEVAEQVPDDADRVNGLLRRVHAVGSAARVLGFASVAEALAEAERSVRSAPQRGRKPFAEVARALDLLPSLVLGAPASTRDPESRERAAPVAFPISVLVLGSKALADALTEGAGEAVLECERTDDADRAIELARMVGPDAAVIDGDHPRARDVLDQLLGDALIEPLPVVVVGSFDNPEATRAFVELGVDRVLAKPASPDVLRRTVEELRQRSARPRASRDPLGDVTVAALSERIAHEFKRGLVDALDAGSPQASVPLGEGHDVLAAVWGAVARVRELVTLHSSGALRFRQTGPEGAVPLAPWTRSERRAGERGLRLSREPEGVSLNGRKILVADDDPAVVWFMSGLLKAVGVEVLEAHDGQRALELTFGAQPDVVVSDVLMPKLDGFSLCHEIKRDVAVRDTPVILLSWKEDLLQRVRELGASADGYLRKEAAASAVVERVREVLRPRARVEARILAGGEVRGRLDGITPRLVLELVCLGGGNVRVSVRDAAFLFEAQVRRGRLVSLSRSSVNGGFVRGETVLGSLLGASAGRFVVEPDDSSTRVELKGTLAELMAAPLGRARAGLGAVSQHALVRLRKLELDRPLVEAYLPSTPAPAAALLKRLLAGEPVRELVLGGSAESRLLEVVLSDIARRGGVVSAELDPPSIAPVPSAPPPEPEPERLGAGTKPGVSPLDEHDAGWFADATSEPTPPGTDPLRPSDPGAPEAGPTNAPVAANHLAATEPEPPTTPAREAPETAAAFASTMVAPGPSLRIGGLSKTLPLDASKTPATAEASAPLFHFGGEAARTLEGVGAAPVAARTLPLSAGPTTTTKPDEAPTTAKSSEAAAASGEPEEPLDAARPPARSTPELGAVVAGEDVLGLLGDNDVSSAPPKTARSAPRNEAAEAVPAAAPRKPETHEPAGLDELDPEPTSPAPPRIVRTSPRDAQTEPPQPRRGRPEAPEASGSWAAAVGKGLLAFGVAFGVTNFVVLPLISPEEPRDEPTAATPAVSAASIIPVASSANAPALMTDDLEPPPDMTLKAGNGVIEIETPGTDPIYVDGQFVGSGPVRRVPAVAGQHRVEIRGSTPMTQEVTLSAGRRARVRQVVASATPAPGTPR